MLSADPLRLSSKSAASLRFSFRRLFRRSISSRPLSRVKDRKAINLSAILVIKSSGKIADPQISSCSSILRR